MRRIAVGRDRRDDARLGGERDDAHREAGRQPVEEETDRLARGAEPRGFHVGRDHRARDVDEQDHRPLVARPAHRRARARGGDAHRRERERGERERHSPPPPVNVAVMGSAAGTTTFRARRRSGWPGRSCGNAVVERPPPPVAGTQPMYGRNVEGRLCGPTYVPMKTAFACAVIPGPSGLPSEPRNDTSTHGSLTSASVPPTTLPLRHGSWYWTLGSRAPAPGAGTTTRRPAAGPRTW